MKHRWSEINGRRNLVVFLATLFAVLAASVLLASCDNQQQIRDLEDVPQTEPDKVRLVTNVDTYPNVVALCIEGAGFASTTRDYTSLIRVEVWDRTWCNSVDDGAEVQQ